MRKIVSLFVFNGSLLIASAAHAVCPVCTVAVGAGLEGARLLGVDDVITGVWAGGFILIMIFWTAKFLKRRKIENAAWYVLDVVAWYALLAAMYLTPGLTYGANAMWGIDRFLLGVVAGSVVLYAAELWSHKLIRENGGKSRFKFQKVVVPFGALLAASGVFAAILYI